MDQDRIVRQHGDRLSDEPTPRKSLLSVLAALEPLDEDFPPIADLEPDPVEL
jgi:antitoxin VapB